MIGPRGALATFLAISFVVMILFGFSDKLNKPTTGVRHETTLSKP